MKKWIWVIVPTLVLGVFILLFVLIDSRGVMSRNLPPIEKVAVERIELGYDTIRLRIAGDGPDPVTIAQVIVNDAYRQFTQTPVGPIRRMASADITIPYPWETGEPVNITLVSSTGITFPVNIEAAASTPVPNLDFILILGLIGVFIGVIPVFLGLLWLPFLKKSNESSYRFFLMLTLGLLFFLGIDSLEEAISVSGSVPDSLNATGVIVLGFSAAFLITYAASRRGGKSGKSKDNPNAALDAIAFSIAVGIGVHNLGEGLAVGGAYAIGEATLGAALVIGFMIHNLTEGVAIVAPLSRSRSRIGYLVLLGLIAGAPAIAGAWIGGFAYSAFWAVLFLSIGAGAIFQVFIEILSHIAPADIRDTMTPVNVSGFLFGIVIMYVTSLLVAV